MTIDDDLAEGHASVAGHELEPRVEKLENAVVDIKEHNAKLEERMAERKSKYVEIRPEKINDPTRLLDFLKKIESLDNF